MRLLEETKTVETGRAQMYAGGAQMVCKNASVGWYARIWYVNDTLRPNSIPKLYFEKNVPLT